MSAKGFKTTLLNAFEKTPKWITKFFYSDLYLGALAALILASWISGIMLIGFLSIIIFATVILVIHDDIKPLIPILFYVAFCISDSSDLSVYYPFLPCLIPLILAIGFHLIFYHPKRFSLGELGLSQIFVSIALLIGGCTCISLARWTGALTYSLLLGVGVFFIYFAWTNYMRGTPYGETSTYFAKIFMWMGLILVGEMITYYVKSGVSFFAHSSLEWIDLGWGIDNNVATLLLLAAPMCFYLATQKEHPTLYILIGIIEYLGIVSTYSRGGILFAVITAPIVAVATILKSKNKSESLIIIVCVIIVALTAFAFTYEKILSMIGHIFEDGLKSSSRVLLYKDALHQFAAHPIFGVGTGYDGPDYENHVEEIVFYWFHSTFFQIVGSMGLVGIFVYGWNYLKRAKVIFKNILKDTFVLFSFLSLLGFELYSMIDTGTFVPLPTMMIVFIMFAVVERHHKEQALLPDALMKEEYTLDGREVAGSDKPQEESSLPEAKPAEPVQDVKQAEEKNV